MRCTFVLLVFLSVPTTLPAAGLTEAEAVRRGLERPDIAQLLMARREAAAGRADAAGRWANPELEYSSESAELPGGRVDDRFLWVRQRFNIAGVHGLERDAAGSARRAEEARTDFRARELAAEIRRLFHKALAAEQQAEAVRAWQERLAELSEAVSNRASAGDASRFDALRLGKELAMVSGEASAAEAEAESAGDRLFSFIGVEPVELEGRLLPPDVDGASIAEVLNNHPLLRSLEAEARAATLSSEAAGRRGWPEVTVGVGRRELEEPGVSADGDLLSIGMEIPLFDNGSGEARTASARSRRLSAERALLESRLAADARSVLRELDAQREAALAFRETSPKASLASIAEAAYDAGELSVLELIDAHRTELAAQREASRRALAARESYIRFQMMRGDQP